MPLNNIRELPERPGRTRGNLVYRDLPRGRARAKTPAGSSAFRAMDPDADGGGRYRRYVTGHAESAPPSAGSGPPDRAFRGASARGGRSILGLSRVLFPINWPRRADLCARGLSLRSGVCVARCGRLRGENAPSQGALARI